MMAADLSARARDVNWMLGSFVAQTHGVEHAIAVSADGLLIATSTNLDRAAAERLAAVVSALRSLADGTSRLLERGNVRQVVVEMDTGYLVTASISGGAVLGVVCARESDLGLVGYEATVLVDRFGRALTPELISELKSSLSW